MNFVKICLTCRDCNDFGSFHVDISSFNRHRADTTHPIEERFMCCTECSIKRGLKRIIDGIVYAGSSVTGPNCGDCEYVAKEGTNRNKDRMVTCQYIRQAKGGPWVSAKEPACMLYRKKIKI